MNGEKCNCICIECGTNLIANQGNQRGWHFKHASEDNCSGGIETVLHKRAKEILSEETYFLLPPLIIVEQALSWEPDIDETDTVVLVSYGQKLKLDNIKLVEEGVNQIRPDLIIFSKKVPLMVEIAVTHFVDEEKKQKIIESGISCLEIDISNLKDCELNDSEIKELIVNGIDNKKWIFNIKEKTISNRLKNTLQHRLKNRIDLINYNEKT
ncbi:MAG: hypothetical protein QM500_15610 [Methylococcales bacterium]